LKQAPTTSLVIEYIYSEMLDMGVTDWENNGNLVFFHQPPPGDVSRDGCVDDLDLAAVIFAFGQTGTGLPEDLNGNGTVDDADLALVVFHFGTGC
jgi:hypothetical protein